MDTLIVLLEAENTAVKRFITTYFTTVQLPYSQLCLVNVHINEDLDTQL